MQFHILNKLLLLVSSEDEKRPFVHNSVCSCEVVYFLAYRKGTLPLK